MTEASAEGPDRKFTSEVVVALPLALLELLLLLLLELLPPTVELCPILNVAPTWKYVDT
jgi:hypothetical protein